MEKFTIEVNQGLNKKLEEGDIDELLEVMSYLSKVKDRQQKTDEMFEPLKHIIELLKQYQEELPENVHAQIQVYSRANVPLIISLIKFCNNYV